MHTAKTYIALAVLLLGGALFLAPAAHANLWNQKVKFTFNQPVAIPGRVLPAGTYWFQLVNNESDRNIVQIFSADWSKLYATELAVPVVRRDTTSRIELQFAERPHNQPQALLSWYYPDQVRGHRFVYPQRTERMLARATRREVLSSPNGSTPVAAQVTG
jgi:hypothetical protein